MKVKFNKFERVAGLFVGLAILGSVLGAAGMAIKKGWFERRISFVTEIQNAEGIFAGTAVQVAGIRAGAVEEIELISAEKVKVKFYVFERFREQIRKDSQVQVVRPFVIGDKVFEVSIGQSTEDRLAAGGFIPAVSSFDLMDLVSGRKLAPVLGTFERLSDNLKVLAEAFADPKRTQAMVKMFDRLDPLVRNLNQMSVEVTGLTRELNQVVPDLNRKMPDMAGQMAQIIQNLNVLTREFTKLTPAIQTLAPELPRTTLRAVEALDETVVLLKAMQKSFLLRGKVDEVKEEETRRKPASQEGK